MFDLTIYESGDGGELKLKKNDLETTNSFFNMAFLAMFGGNVEAITTGNELESEQRFDWWGNTYLMPNNPSIQFNYLTEKTLIETSIDSEGRNTILEAVKKDLSFFSNFGDVTVEVFLISVDRVRIDIKILEKSNQENKNFQFIWDSSKNELIDSLIL